MITQQIVNAVDGDGISALHWVAAENGKTTLKFHYAHSSQAHRIYLFKRLFILGNEEIAKLLIENGASVNHKDNKNETALQVAAKKGLHHLL